MNRTASAHWNGSLKEGSGIFEVGSGAIKGQAYNFRQRFENEPGTNPEELIGAAHAACFSMALSGELGKVGITPESVRTTCTITFESGTVARSHLDTTVSAPGADQEKVNQAAEAAKSGCPISRLLKTEITMDARLT